MTSVRDVDSRSLVTPVGDCAVCSRVSDMSSRKSLGEGMLFKEE